MKSELIVLNSAILAAETVDRVRSKRMGYFLRVVAQNLDFQDGDFIQSTTIHDFGREVFVSWSPTPEEPDEHDNWDWLACDTLRVSKREGIYIDKITYQNAPVERRSNG